MNMKRELALTGIAVVISVLLSSPTFAQTASNPVNAAPAPAPIVETQAAAVEEPSLDDAIMMAQTPADRMKLLMRCAGPPPQALQTAKTQPASEPVAIAAR
jgi:hypothetical protein